MSDRQGSSTRQTSILPLASRARPGSAPLPAPRVSGVEWPPDGGQWATFVQASRVGSWEEKAGAGRALESSAERRSRACLRSVSTRRTSRMSEAPATDVWTNRASSQRAVSGHFGSGQWEILERIARGASLPELLSNIVGLVEQQAEGMLCSILTFD